jgi:VanZ family protein
LSARSVLPFAVFLSALGAWTYELLAENPVPESVRRAIPAGWSFWLAKGLHVGAYAALTVLGGLLPVSRTAFYGVVGLLVLHGVAGEVGQTFVPGRTGSVRDVALDWAGIGLGLLALGLARAAGGRRAAPS